VTNACVGKTVIVSEAGWPSDGGCNGNAVASYQDQEVAITAIYEATNGQVTFFSFGDDAWKNPDGPERHFGILLPSLWLYIKTWVGCARLF